MYDSAVLRSVITGIQLTLLLQYYIGVVFFVKNTRRREVCGDFSARLWEEPDPMENIVTSG
jgi:succinate dehydrogenase hydrophobic anchor subunit